MDGIMRKQTIVALDYDCERILMISYFKCDDLKKIMIVILTRGCNLLCGIYTWKLSYNEKIRYKKNKCINEGFPLTTFHTQPQG